ncbi:MAG TPA: hypothetical protein VHU44_00735 [Acidobacteriaceae bacterium]|jgi:hypothetical protein|nr:hypothetical protein [Acidobacteriaceae bacterium]
MTNEVLASKVEAAAKSAGLVVVSTEPGESVDGTKTTKFKIANAGDTAKTLQLELSERFDTGQAELLTGLGVYFAELTKRLRNPRPECHYTLHGLPLSFGRFEWPFHESRSGADTSLVHGEVRLEDGGEAVLHAKVAASMTLTFREVVPAPEQPFAEGFIYNAVRKTMDQGQLELVKSGNRQPVPLTTRYYSIKQKKFIFNDTTPEQRQQFMAGKVFWLSGVLGGGAPVWVEDPRDAQYLDCSPEELQKDVQALVVDGTLNLSGADYAVPTAKLMAREAEFRQMLTQSLEFTRPSFNEEMRAGLTNM